MEMSETARTIAQQIKAGYLVRMCGFRAAYDSRRPNILIVAKGAKSFTVAYDEGADLYNITRRKEARMPSLGQIAKGAKFPEPTIEKVSGLCWEDLHGQIERFFGMEIYTTISQIERMQIRRA